MNCKPGDLAVVVKGVPGWSDHCVGKIVTVKALEFTQALEPAWRYEPPIMCPIMGRPFALLEDAYLRPIRDPGDDAVDETLQRIGAPRSDDLSREDAELLIDALREWAKEPV